MVGLRIINSKEFSKLAIRESLRPKTRCFFKSFKAKFTLLVVMTVIGDDFMMWNLTSTTGCILGRKKEFLFR